MLLIYVCFKGSIWDAQFEHKRILFGCQQILEARKAHELFASRTWNWQQNADFVDPLEPPLLWQRSPTVQISASQSTRCHSHPTCHIQQLAAQSRIGALQLPASSLRFPGKRLQVDYESGLNLASPGFCKVLSKTWDLEQVPRAVFTFIAWYHSDISKFSFSTHL